MKMLRWVQEQWNVILRDPITPLSADRLYLISPRGNLIQLLVTRHWLPQILQVTVLALVLTLAFITKGMVSPLLGPIQVP